MKIAKAFFTEEQQKNILAAIEKAEAQTSGEIVVHLDDRCDEDVLDRAAYIFDFLNLQKTKYRNAVLFYISIEDHKFAILGDAGINHKVEEGFWDSTRDTVISHFKQKKYEEGLTAGILEAGKRLKKYFPYTDDSQDEISNDISFGKNRKS